MRKAIIAISLIVMLGLLIPVTRRATASPRLSVADDQPYGPFLDKDKKDEVKKSEPAKLTLTTAQTKALEEVDQAAVEVERKYKEQIAILQARQNGLVTAFTIGTPLAGKPLSLKKEKELYVLEEIPPKPEPSPEKKDKP